MTTIHYSAVNFNSTDAAAAYKRLIVKYGRDTRWQKAIRRAWDHLQQPGWQWNGRELVTRSDSDASRRYRTRQATCDCPAGDKQLICWHAAAWWICHEATRHASLQHARNN